MNKPTFNIDDLLANPSKPLAIPALPSTAMDAVKLLTGYSSDEASNPEDHHSVAPSPTMTSPSASSDAMVKTLGVITDTSTSTASTTDEATVLAGKDTEKAGISESTIVAGNLATVLAGKASQLKRTSDGDLPPQYRLVAKVVCQQAMKALNWLPHGDYQYRHKVTKQIAGWTLVGLATLLYEANSSDILLTDGDAARALATWVSNNEAECQAAFKNNRKIQNKSLFAWTYNPENPLVMTELEAIRTNTSRRTSSGMSSPDTPANPQPQPLDGMAACSMATVSVNLTQTSAKKKLPINAP
jgi:hypothetical protein